MLAIYFFLNPVLEILRANLYSLIVPLVLAAFILPLVSTMGWSNYVLGWLVVYLTWDIFPGWISAAFTRRVPASLLRSVTGLLVSYLSVVVAFSAIYGFLPSCAFKVEKLTWSKALYFSLATIAGEIQHNLSAWYWYVQLLVGIELLLGLFLVAVLLAIVVGWVSAPPYGTQPLEVWFGHERLFLLEPSSPLFIQIGGKYCPALDNTGR